MRPTKYVSSNRTRNTVHYVCPIPLAAASRDDALLLRRRQPRFPPPSPPPRPTPTHPQHSHHHDRRLCHRRLPRHRFPLAAAAAPGRPVRGRPPRLEPEDEPHTDEAEVMTRHVADSFAMLPPLERAYRARSAPGGGGIDGVNLIDVGSGAGLPGLILAVARPSWRFTLLESMRKRCTFLEHAVEVMGLSNNVGQSLDFREAYDIAAARAVAELEVLAEYCLPLIRVGGLFIAAKGHDPHKQHLHTMTSSICIDIAYINASE
ncbi:uncharacterized protein LOC133930198 [Phragmites australis]|uniref:uncharacterized protein LOC133930198 n=1 Tax=Phragmites australis TaxID=29695 RepID=UPI002D7697B2|nr:uncharacterized protein LOC133930198 [Phragmites australis]